MASLSEVTRLSGAKTAKPQPAEASAPPPVKRSRALVRVTVLLYPDEIDELDALWEAHGFKSRHHLLQWLTLAGIKALKLGTFKPERRSSRITEVIKP